MERKKDIGLRKGSSHSALRSLLFIFTLCSLLLAFFAVSVEAADKLVVKDSEGEIKFVVTDEGKVCIGNTVPVQ
jgi:hypothetical protein